MSYDEDFKFIARGKLAVLTGRLGGALWHGLAKVCSDLAG